MYIEEIGFSLWLDFIERGFLQKDFSSLIERGIVSGATSNPAIFKEAILKSPAYKEQLHSLKGEPKERYEALAVEDIKEACKILLPLYERGDDGFVSIEVDPRLANDASGSVKEAYRLLRKIDMPNVMIKIPATAAGYEAMAELLGDGVHVNATLVFSPEQAKGCLDAFEKALANSSRAKSVISIFVSRFDRKLDSQLPDSLRGRTGIMNAAKIYSLIQKRNLPNTRALFASTSVKGGDYPGDYYITELLAPNSINTAPLHTIEAFVEHGVKEAKLPIQEEEIDRFFQALKESGVDIKMVYDELFEEGLSAFEEAFEEILRELA